MLHLQLVGLLHMHASCISAACGDIDHAPARYPAAPDSIIEPNNKSLDSSPGAHSQPPPAPAVARPANTRLRGRRCLLPYTIASIHPSIPPQQPTTTSRWPAGVLAAHSRHGGRRRQGDQRRYYCSVVLPPCQIIGHLIFLS